MSTKTRLFYGDDDPFTSPRATECHLVGSTPNLGGRDGSATRSLPWTTPPKGGWVRNAPIYFGLGRTPRRLKELCRLGRHGFGSQAGANALKTIPFLGSQSSCHGASLSWGTGAQDGRPWIPLQIHHCCLDPPVMPTMVPNPTIFNHARNRGCHAFAWMPKL